MEAGRRTELKHILRSTPWLMSRLERARALGLSQWRLVAGAIYNTVWNRMTGRDPLFGISDLDIAYFDPDLSYAAEDREIQRAQQAFPDRPPVELRNQARVHLWYRSKFGAEFAPLASIDEGLARYLSPAQAVGVRLDADGDLDIAAPFGLEPLFAMRLEPNPGCPGVENFPTKAAQLKALWPELSVPPHTIQVLPK